jgi:hypothetical protein
MRVLNYWFRSLEDREREREQIHRNVGTSLPYNVAIPLQTAAAVLT